jgi:flagellar biosynthetic protein FlhB
MPDKSQQTEKPTQRRIDQSRKEGRFPTSREAVGAFQFLTFCALLSWFGAAYCWHVIATARYLFQAAFTSQLSANEVTRLMGLVLRRDFLPLGISGGILMLASLSAQLGVTRGGLSVKSLTPNLKRLSPLSKMRELPRQNIPALLQAAVLLPLFASAVYGIVQDNWNTLLKMPLQEAETGARQMALSVQSLLWKAALMFLILGAVDLWRQNRRYTADLRMSKQDLREESKEMEGNPQIRGRLRQLRRDWLRRRMMSQVPKATAVVVNPTHYAVAIRYAMESMAAPVVVAKGRNYLAQRIRLMAIHHQVPVVENPPLAQALYKTAEVGQEIPPHLFRAVAEVLAYIYRIMGNRLPS